MSSPRERQNQDNFSTFFSRHDWLAADVGDLNTLIGNIAGLSVTDEVFSMSVVDILGYLDDRIDGFTVDALTLANDTWLPAAAFGGGTVNILKVNVSDTIEFGANVSTIDITGGTITGLSSPLPIASGGTAGATASAARTALSVQELNVNLTDISGLSPTLNNFIMGDNANFTLVDATAAKAGLGLVIDTNVQAWSENLDDIASQAITENSFLMGSAVNHWVKRTDTEMKTLLNLYTGASGGVQDWNVYLDQFSTLIPSGENFVVGGGSSWTQKTKAETLTLLGTTPGTEVQDYNLHLDEISAVDPLTDGDILVALSGAWVGQDKATARGSIDAQTQHAYLDDIATTDPATLNSVLVFNGSSFIASVEADFKTRLNLEIDYDVQAYSSNLDEFSVLTSALNYFVVGSSSSGWERKNQADARTALQLVKGAVGGVQEYSLQLKNIAALTPTDGNIIVGNGSTWIAESGLTARNSLDAAKKGINTDITQLNALTQINSNLSLVGADIYPTSAGALDLGLSNRHFGSVWASSFLSPGAMSITSSTNSVNITSNTDMNFNGNTSGGSYQMYFKMNSVSHWTISAIGNFYCLGGAKNIGGGAVSTSPGTIYFSEKLDYLGTPKAWTHDGDHTTRTSVDESNYSYDGTITGKCRYLAEAINQCFQYLDDLGLVN